MTDSIATDVAVTPLISVSRRSLGAHYKSVAKCIARLIERGYLDAQGEAQDGRLRVYRVIYNDEEEIAFHGDGRTHTPHTFVKIVDDEQDRPVALRATDHAADPPCGALPQHSQRQQVAPLKNNHD